MSDFISSLSRLARKITVIKKAAKHSAESEGNLSSPTSLYLPPWPAAFCLTSPFPLALAGGLCVELEGW